MANIEYNEEIDWDNLLPNKKKQRPAAPKPEVPKPRPEAPAPSNRPKPRKESGGGGGGGGMGRVGRWLRDFPHNHPIILNLLLMIIAGYVAVWILMMFVGKWTHHGQEVRVPDVKELPMNVAAATLDRGGFSYEVIDSVYEARVGAGCVVSQTPTAGAAVKPGRTVYLTVVASSPKTVVVPEYEGMSLRTVQASFEGLGLKHVDVEYVPSDYEDLVLGARINGRELHSGERIPLNSSIVLEVGAGAADDDEYDAEEDREIELYDDESGESYDPTYMYD